MSNGWKAYSGVVHVHTDQSGGAPLDDILEAAGSTGVDFVVLTDHLARRAANEKIEGWRPRTVKLINGYLPV